MDYSLIAHPTRDAPDIDRVTVSVDQSGPQRLNLAYCVQGDIAALVMPPVTRPIRVDGLWQTTCFELFAGRPDEEPYAELNFSPTTRWAAYRFDGYRKGMRPLTEAVVERIDLRREWGAFRMQVAIDIPHWTGGFEEDWSLGLAAVIEHRGGMLSYWALAHGGDTPDFHDRASFIGILPAVRGS